MCKLSAIISGLLVVFLTALACQNPAAPDGEEFVVYAGSLMSGFDTGVEDSRQDRNWLTDRGGFFQMNYPGYEASNGYGSVFIVVGTVPLEMVSENFGYFNSLSVDLKGELGGEDVMITIEEKEKPSSIFKYLYGLSTEWQTFNISLSEFSDIDLTKLHTVIKFSFFGHCKQTVYFRNIKFHKKTLQPETTTEYSIYMGYMLAPGYSIGINTGPDSLKYWLFDECGSMKMVYPAHQEWGVIFIYNNEFQNFSGYDTLSVELKSENGREVVYVEILDTICTAPTIIDYPIPVTNSWTEYKIPLNFFQQNGIDLMKLRIVINFFFLGTESKTIHFRNIKYL
jgi:hypothetical protein